MLACVLLIVALPTTGALSGAESNPAPPVEIDVLQAFGMPQDQLEALVQHASDQRGAPMIPLMMLLLTQGHISRYSAWINYGRPMIGMSLTADFCPGSSGAPVFAATGSVAGIVARVHDLGGGMVDKQCMPAQAIQALLRTEP